METISALEDHLGYWLRLVSNHVSQAFADKLRDRDVTVAEWVALRVLYDGALPPSDLAQRLGMTRGAVSKLADRLIARKLLVRSASAVDGRAQILALTPTARTLVPKLAALADRNDGEFFGGLNSAERAQLEKLLLRIVKTRRLGGIPVT